ncbi:MAG: RidA family protein [Anaerolineae bacterium]
MERMVVRTSDAPRPSGCYSQAVRVGGFVFTAGLSGTDPRTGKLVPGGIGAQVRQALENMRAILEEAGTSLGNVVKVTVYLRDFDDFDEYNAAYSEYFNPEVPPARTTVEVGSFPGEMAVEVDAIACMPDS